MIEWLFLQTSQALGMLAVAGAIAGLYRWEKAKNRPFLLIFIVFMIGTALREAIVYQWGNIPWNDVALGGSMLSRVLQIGAAIAFIRMVTKDVCPPWVMILFLFLITFAVVML